MSNNDQDKATPDTPAKRPICGIVRPISAFKNSESVFEVNYTEKHWEEVHAIVAEAVDQAGFDLQLVSETEGIDVIHTTIVRNVHDLPVVVCDVSGKNSNVMLELGMRLAFGKQAVIIKDDVTKYSFDTSPLKHVGYRHDLRFQSVVDFQAKLATAVKLTHEMYLKNPDYSPFLEAFGKFTVPKLDTQEVPVEKFLLSELQELKQLMRQLVPSRGSGAALAELLKSVDSNADVFKTFDVDAEHQVHMVVDQVFEQVRAEGKVIDSPEALSRIHNRLKELNLPYCVTIRHDHDRGVHYIDVEPLKINLKVATPLVEIRRK